MILQDGPLHHAIWTELEELYQHFYRRITALEQELASDLVKTPYVRLMAILGINVVSAAEFAGEMGPMARYANANAITGRAGLYPARHQSDQTDKEGPIIRQVNRRLRCVLMRIADNLACHCHYYRAQADTDRACGVDTRASRMTIAKRFIRILLRPPISTYYDVAIPPNMEVAMEVKPHLPLSELKRLERSEKNADRSRRLRIMILGTEGWTAPAVAMAVGLSRRICQRWVARYNAEGLAGLDDRRGHESGLPISAEDEAILRQRIEAGPIAKDEVCTLRGKDFQRILANEFGLLRSLPSVYWLLHLLGYSYLRPRPRHRKADPEKVADFVQGWPTRLQAIAAVHPDKQLRIYFQDESHFGQQGTTTNVWAEKGSRPTAIRQTEYEYLWVLGAVCPETGHAEGLLSPQLNTKIINLFLELFSKTIPAGEQAVMIWDGAGFHTSKQLVVPDNVTLVQLPAYSPELNPIENLWHYLKSHF